jgi:hypothetical protein
MKRIVAWCIFGSVCYGAYAWASTWRNPLASDFTVIDPAALHIPSCKDKGTCDGL